MRQHIGSFNAHSLTAFTDKTGRVDMWRDGNTFFISGTTKGGTFDYETEQDYIWGRMLDSHSSVGLELSPAGETMLAEYRMAVEFDDEMRRAEDAAGFTG